ARVICLLPADSADDRWVEYVLRSAHAVERHPISEGGLIDLVGRAVDDYRRAREMVTRLLPRDARGQDGWRQAERDLAEALAAFVQVHASEPEHHLPAPDHV